MAGLTKYRVVRAGVFRLGNHTLIGPMDGESGHVVTENMFSVKEWRTLLARKEIAPVDAPDSGGGEEVKSLTGHIADLEDACEVLRVQVQDQEALVVEKQAEIDTLTDEVKQLQKPVKKTKKKDK